MADRKHPARIIFQATLETRHFNFDAVGTTAPEARQFLVEGLRIHCAQYEIDYDHMREEYDDECINVREIAMGTAYRDGGALKED